MPGTIERVFVAGPGLMGHGIAQVHAAIGLPVTLYEPDLARAEAGRERIAGNLDRAVAKGRLTADERDATLARIESPPTSLAVADADLVIEAVFEDIAVKTVLWRELDGLAPAHAIFASNTSSIAIHRLAEAVGPRASRAVRRDAFLQPRAGHAADRARSAAARRATRRSTPSGPWPRPSASRSSSRPTGRASSSTGS